MELYQKALSILKDPLYDNVMVYLHDYDQEVYRSKPQYTLNGLHWGYPDAITESLVGVNPETNIKHNSVNVAYAYFASGPYEANPQEKANIESNSRFQKVPYKEVRKIIERGIRQKMALAKKRAKKEEIAREKWLKFINKEFEKYFPAAMRITLDKKRNFYIAVLKPERTTFYGFGTFIENIKQNEISISPEAVEQLKRLPERSGLTGINIHPNLISYGCRAPTITVPPEDGYMQKGAWETFGKLVKIEP